MQIPESRSQRVVSVRFGLVLVAFATLALGAPGAAEAAQSCSDLAAAEDMEMVSSAAEVPGVYIARLNAGDAERVTDLFADDAVHRGPDGQIRRGRAAILRSTRASLPTDRAGWPWARAWRTAAGWPSSWSTWRAATTRTRHRGGPDRRQRRQPDSGLHGVLPAVRQLSRADPRSPRRAGARTPAPPTARAARGRSGRCCRRTAPGARPPCPAGPAAGSPSASAPDTGCGARPPAGRRRRPRRGSAGSCGRGGCRWRCRSRRAGSEWSSRLPSPSGVAASRCSR